MALAAVIVPFDLIHIHRPGDAVLLVEIAQVIGEIGIVDDAAQVAFEVAVIDRVEANQRGEQPPVCLRDVFADEVALAREPPLDLVERAEYRAERLLVGFLRGGEAGPIDAVVHVLVNERVDAVDLFAQR